MEVPHLHSCILQHAKLLNNPYSTTPSESLPTLFAATVALAGFTSIAPAINSDLLIARATMSPSSSATSKSQLSMSIRFSAIQLFFSCRVTDTRMRSRGQG